MHPLLYLGLIGFDAQEREAVHAYLTANAQQARRDGADDDALNHPIWEIVDYSQADALLICGRAVIQAEDNTLYFHQGTDMDAHLTQEAIDGDATVRISQPMAVNLEELRMPCAITQRQQLMDDGVMLAATYQAVDLQDGRSILAALQRFEAVLRPLRSMYALAGALIERRSELDVQHTYHLEDNGTLHMILDVPQRRLFMRSTVRPVDIQIAAWSQRPKSANYAPPDFIECTFEEVAWVFALHSPRVNLPSRYGRKAIYIRRMPRVRPSMFYERHTPLFELLHLKPSSLSELMQQPEIDSRFIERDLFALYICRAITTTPIKGVPSTLPPSSDFEVAARIYPHDATSGLHEASAFDRLGRSMNTVNASLERL
jgi:hypothetical protein